MLQTFIPDLEIIKVMACAIKEIVHSSMHAHNKYTSLF